uniref:Uncharacterized protein n=1 Tax=Candidatus Kentrum sp. TC TaxID=2126339 RepID=A0A451A8S3_9GAMM|nr:MAG: hypothetical protein BECKTC1821F_GA0114240_10748 [Candidatus Kentron sp. TC]
MVGAKYGRRTSRIFYWRPDSIVNHTDFLSMSATIMVHLENLRDYQSIGEPMAALIKYFTFYLHRAASPEPWEENTTGSVWLLPATSCWQRSHGGLCSERFAGNFRPIRVPWGIYIMVAPLWTCGRVLRTGLRPSGRVDSPWTTLRVAHRLPTFSGLSPTESTALQQRIFISYFLEIVLTKSPPRCRLSE